MKIYFAGVIGNGTYLGGTWKRLTDHQRAIVRDAKNYLESYHYFNKDEQMEKARSEGLKLFLDSGAFSAFTKNISVDLPEYCNFIKRNADTIDVASVLDVVGDPLGTWQNQQRMEALGVRPLPCFHYGEDERYLEYYVANYDYITLGGMVPISAPQLRVWLDRIWDKYLIDGAGRAKVKVHGFGMTTLGLFGRYPWWSVDSSSWVQVAMVGSIMHPDYGIVAISSTNPARKNEGRHFNTLSHAEQSVIANECARLGFSLWELQRWPYSRWVFCLWAYTELGRRIDTHKLAFHREQPGLF